MSIKKIESNLDKLVRDNKLATPEGFEAMETWILQMTKSEFGFVDDLIIPSDLKVKKIGGGRFITRPRQRSADTIYVFLHTGISLDLEFAKFLKLDNWWNIADTVYENYDRGGRALATELLEEMSEDKNCNYAIAVFDISRVLCDANRITREEQVVHQSYKGVPVWECESDKEAIGKRLADPFVFEFEKFTKKMNPKFIFFVHTYDHFGGGKPSGKHEIVTGFLERPFSMVFNHHKLDKKAYGIYLKKQKAEVDLLSSKHIDIVQFTQKKHLSKIRSVNGNKIEVPVDYPYASPRQLPILVSSYFKGPQLVLEFRKDLFRYGFENIMDSIKEITKLIVNAES
jgi:hypothetical protein